MTVSTLPKAAHTQNNFVRSHIIQVLITPSARPKLTNDSYSKLMDVSKLGVNIPSKFSTSQSVNLISSRWQYFPFDRNRSTVTPHQRANAFTWDLNCWGCPLPLWQTGEFPLNLQAIPSYHLSPQPRSIRCLKIKKCFFISCHLACQTIPINPVIMSYIWIPWETRFASISESPDPIYRY